MARRPIIGTWASNEWAAQRFAEAFDGNGGKDVVGYNNSNAGVTVNLVAGKGTGGLATGDTYVQIEDIIGSNFKDIIRGNAGANELRGLAGDDFLEGRAGNDTLNGGIGNDVLLGDDGNDVLYAIAGNDKLYGGVGADILGSGTGNDILNGGGGSDRFLFDFWFPGDGTNRASNRSHGEDWIEDFSAGEEIVFTDLRKMDVDTLRILEKTGKSGSEVIIFAITGSGAEVAEIHLEGKNVKWLASGKTHDIPVSDLPSYTFSYDDLSRLT